MSVLTAGARKVVESAPLAHLVTINPSGGPRITCVSVADRVGGVRPWAA